MQKVEFMVIFLPCHCETICWTVAWTIGALLSKVLKSFLALFLRVLKIMCFVTMEYPCQSKVANHDCQHFDLVALSI